ncbi:MAG: TonB-dependent receptor family protein [Tannerella sp.]|jgi:outer membrane receptor protein involved in Fe transport|nr:TonB-dependent receptor family protein [Tannerella sp.]
MKNLLVLLISIIGAGSVFAQSTNRSPVVVRGEVLDSLTSDPVPYATVRLTPAANPAGVLTAVATDAAGKFSLNVKDFGDYRLVISYIGKTEASIPLQIETEKPVNLGKIYLSDHIGELSEVTVTALKPLIKVDLDKIAYSMENDPEAKTSNVLDMLRKVPLVTVDGEENISLKGSSNFKIYLNGKPSNMISSNPRDVLKSMPANVVKNVEVITDPGAKYDAEGVAGIINIVTQSQTRLGGYTATARLGVSSRSGLDGGLYAMMKYGKVGFTGFFDYFSSKVPESKTGSTRESYIDNTNKYLYQDGSRTFSGNGQYGSGEISYEIDTLNLINFGMNRYQWNGENDMNGFARMENLNHESLYEYTNRSIARSKQGPTGVNVDFQHTSPTVADRLFTLSYRLSLSPNNSRNENTIGYPDGVTLPEYIDEGIIRQFTNAETREHTFQADYTTPLHKIHTVEAGVKYIIRINESNSDYEREFNGVSDPDYMPYGQEKYITQFENRNDILAAYAGYGLKLKNWGFKPGLRYEYTRLNAKYPLDADHNFGVNYSNLVPSFTVTYKINNMQNIRLGYNLRISRPGIGQLNPYVNNSNPNYISYGNPELDAVRSHSVNMNYGYFNPKITLNTNLSYDFTDNGIESVAFEMESDDQKGVSASTYRNIGKSKRLNLSSYFNWSPSLKLRAYGNLFGTYADIRANNGSGMENSGFYGQGYFGMQYKLPWNIWISGYLGGGKMGVSLQQDGSYYFFHSLGLRKSFLKDRLMAQFYVSNPFRDEYSRTMETWTETYYQRSVNAWKERELRISVSYRFGEMKTQIKKTKRSIVNDDVLSSGQGSEGKSPE